MVSERKDENWKTWGKNGKMLERKRETREMMKRNRKTMGKNLGKTWAKDGKPGKKCKTFGNKNKKTKDVEPISSMREREIGDSGD